ncbi:MAG: sugar phosphate isomerase/epimerase [Ktedonobacteraceae bacterium]|nr:sugar phosphate isomerase/epimerase [Ktedonobacteraceae bacterium]MBO0795082.1 sugar phosphate isomerase/epimerase [Ktedonobacteraceae bacterium]
MTNTSATPPQPRLSVSTWSLHRAIGDPRIYDASRGHDIPTETHGRGALSLLELPARIADFGIHTMEICHFHLPSLDKGYLTELRGALRDAKVELFSLLIDEGDITHPDNASRDLAWIGSWLDVAGHLGAQRARVIAGKAAPSEETLAMSARGLQRLLTRSENLGLRLMTENWYGLLSSPASVHALFERLEGRVGLCFDFGNWRGPGKYADLQSIASYAESCHAKASFTPPYEMDKDDYTQCLDITRSANFSGPYTLIYDGPGSDEWVGLAQEQQVVQPYLSTH